ncbi:MAG TPA: T9SS type A sorting domain-containing protein [Cyclobacteriaceae bacterium]|nr:T9SS type A sorting domain-containing protein [Cyclobacteriaceae bacterium]MCB9237003.1 T9SS type A sorting domain-containing protein [Flammeovirgaceae bacterium]MCB0498427.1 T9SS type A sorting domain-containing protein [Cyclobacteriaceae bacterium]MCO5271649.1 T9SS type A sorting domain-containing protein [Cyclobacteriaceae bacterium]MCW5901287.1 T9SS type A sorting domain-containing protein [Cyclobacteriaceae bacterium]
MKLVKVILLFALFWGFSFVGYGQNQGQAIYQEAGLSDRLVQMYPNPASDYLTVKLPTPHAASVQLALHSVIGNELNVEKEQIDAYEVRIRVKDLPSGYYFLSIKDAGPGLKATYKFLKR